MSRTQAASIVTNRTPDLQIPARTAGTVAKRTLEATTGAVIWNGWLVQTPTTTHTRICVKVPSIPRPAGFLRGLGSGRQTRKRIGSRIPGVFV